jgi:uncharacterized protein (TIGR02246 family)
MRGAGGLVAYLTKEESMESKDLYRALLDAWNRRDATAFAQLFSPEGSIVGFDGSTANSSSEIESHLAPIFADHPTAALVGKIRDVRQIGNDCFLIRAVASMIPPGKRHIMPERNTIQTLLASKSQDGSWQIEMFQNTPARFDGRPEEARRLAAEIEAELAETP